MSIRIPAACDVLCVVLLSVCEALLSPRSKLVGTGALHENGFFSEAAAESPASATSILVLYDDAGQWGWLGELYASAVSALVSHFGRSTAKPISRYRAGDLARYRAAFYVGSTYDQPIPKPFLTDVLDGKRPVVWIGDNIWQLAHEPGFEEKYGFEPSSYRHDALSRVRYKGVTLKRFAGNPMGLMAYKFVDTAKAHVLAGAMTGDGAETPWALRSKNLVYIGENPITYIDHDDRYLAFCDILFDVLASKQAERHRALVRIEDVHPESSPAALRSIADYLSSQNVPFSVALIPRYRDPRGALNHGVPIDRSLADAPEVVAALRYMMARGGTLVMHGYTHQYDGLENPYNGVSAADFEFFRTRIGAGGSVVMAGPVPEDRSDWARARIDAGLRIFREVQLPRPEIFEYPHYAGSVADSLAIGERFASVYQRETYYAGVLAKSAPNYTRSINIFFPYPVTDVYGWRVLPENLGCYVPAAYNGNTSRNVADIVESARLNRVVRDGFASFFFHATFPVDILGEIVRGIKSQGYTFVSVADL